jgi:hypothetical protein
VEELIPDQILANKKKFVFRKSNLYLQYKYCDFYLLQIYEMI